MTCFSFTPYTYTYLHVLQVTLNRIVCTAAFFFFGQNVQVTGIELGNFV